MGIIRGGLLVVVSVLLLLSFLVGNVFLTLSLSLDYDNVKSELVPIVKELVEDEMDLGQVIEEHYPFMEEYCENNTEYVFNEQGYTMVIPCDVVLQGHDAVVIYSIDALVEEIYYKDYDCSFWDCLKETEQPFFLVSQKAHDYWLGKFYILLVFSIILIALIFFLVEQKTNLSILVGILLAISALPFMKLNWILSFISEESFLQFFTVFFAKSYVVFLISFILGLIIIALGVVLKFFVVGFKISDFFSKFSKKSSNKKDNTISKKEVKEIMKEEISKKGK